MPKGVEHFSRRVAQRDMHREFLPLMPKGVEHKNRTGLKFRSEFLPLMPKGVEHCRPLRTGSLLGGEFLPLMPKGVEHLALNWVLGEDPRGVPSVDAERR